MCEICGKREPQTQNTEDTNLGMIIGYAQDIIDIADDYRTGRTYYATIEDVFSDMKDKVSYLADHMAAL